jgi:hypothetical protein
LAARYGLRRFSLDAFWYAFTVNEPRKSPDEQWLLTPPEEQADEFEATSHEMHLRALVELAHLPPMPTVVEGPQVQPDLVPDGDRAVFLIPTPDFQTNVLEPRPMPSSDPQRALQNRLIKDRIYADRIAARAQAAGYAVLDVEGTHDLADEVAAVLQIEPEPIDLAAARRWENKVVAANLRAWLDSPEAPREPLGALSFACECGTPSCDKRVEMTLDEFVAADRVIAH